MGDFPFLLLDASLFRAIFNTDAGGMPFSINLLVNLPFSLFDSFGNYLIFLKKQLDIENDYHYHDL